MRKRKRQRKQSGECLPKKQTTSQIMNQSNTLRIKTSETSKKFVNQSLMSLLPKLKACTKMQLKSQARDTWRRINGFKKNILLLRNWTSHKTGGMLWKTTLQTITSHNTTFIAPEKFGKKFSRDLKRLFPKNELQASKSSKISNCGRDFN